MTIKCVKMELDLSQSRPLKAFKPGLIVSADDTMQAGYQYELQAPVGQNFAEDFDPELSPAQMLQHGVFEGKYLNDCTGELPREWYQDALKADKLSSTPNTEKNYFQIKSRQPLSTWIEKGWITPGDPDLRGWFQWYCRYYLGRRDPQLDERQIKRWKAFARHRGQVKKNCEAGNLYCRPRQRQALLQWAYDPFI